MTERPTDLLPVSEAAVLVNRSLSTLRGWVRKGDLAGYREDPTRPTNSRLMVSRSALRTRCGVHPALVATPQNPSQNTLSEAKPGATHQNQPGVSQLELESARAVIDVLRGTVSALEGRIEAEQQLTEQWRDRAERSRAALRAARGELTALQAHRRLTWWQRLFGVRAALPLQAK